MDFKNVFFYFLLQGKLFQPHPLMFVFFLWQSKQIQISIQRPIPVLTFYLHHLLMNIAHVKLNNNQSINVVDIYFLYAKEMISTCETCCTFKLAKYLILSWYYLLCLNSHLIVYIQQSKSSYLKHYQCYLK